MSSITVYDPRGLDFKYWASLMCELFADQNLMIPSDNTDWREWAYGMAGNGYFGAYNVPLPSSAETWDEWAIRVFEANIDTGAT